MFSLNDIEIMIKSNTVASLVKLIKNHHIQYKTDFEEYFKSVPQILIIFAKTVEICVQDNQLILTDENQELLLVCIKFLRSACAQDSKIQDIISENTNLYPAVVKVLTKNNISNEWNIIKKFCWEFLINLIVKNENSTKHVWRELSEFLFTKMENNHQHVGLTAALLYYSFLADVDYNHLNIPREKLFSLFIQVLERDVEQKESNLDFVHFCLEFFVTKMGNFEKVYLTLARHDKIWALYYIIDHIKSDNTTAIEKEFLESLSNEFNEKSDRILVTKNINLDEIESKEMMALLECMTAVSGIENYDKIYANETSLFINVCSLLLAIHKIGSEDKNQFTPLSKLEDVAMISEAKSMVEQEVFFELKTLLVRFIANLSHKNRKNQDLARDLNVILIICTCTTLDARNPLIKEWAIVAIRNLLEHNEENQKMIYSLTKTGMAKNDLLSDFHMEDGMLRINNKKQ